MTEVTLEDNRLAAVSMAFFEVGGKAEFIKVALILCLLILAFVLISQISIYCFILKN